MACESRHYEMLIFPFCPRFVAHCAELRDELRDGQCAVERVWAASESITSKMWNWATQSRIKQQGHFRTWIWGT